MILNCDHEFITGTDGSKWCWKCDEYLSPEDIQSSNAEAKADADREERLEHQPDQPTPHE